MNPESSNPDQQLNDKDAQPIHVDDAVTQYVDGLAAAIIEEAYEKGEVIEIPSLGITILKPSSQ